MNEKVTSLMERREVTRKGAERIAAIVDVGSDILRTEGFTALTKRRIAKRLGISDGNVSYYFPTRESLWQGVIEHELEIYYEKHYRNFRAPADDPEARFDEFVRLWFREYEDRDLRIFFAQLLAFSEVSAFVARQRNDIYQRFYEETRARVDELSPGLPEAVLQSRAALVMSMLEGLHALTTFKPDVMRTGAEFQEQLLVTVKAIALGEAPPRQDRR